MMLTETIKWILVATYRQAPSVVILTALVLLLAAAITLAIEKKYLALQLGNYAFYLLVAGVILSVINLIREGTKKG